MALVAGACGPARRTAAPGPIERADAALDRARRFLLSRQAEDGSFRSKAYAAFRDGHSLSPLALLALRLSGGDDGGPYRRGVGFVATLARTEARRAASYPVYATATAILLLNVPENGRHDGARAVLLRELRALQATEELGWTPSDPAYGGWGYAHGPRRKPASGETGALSSNLSSTLFAVGALRLSGASLGDPALERARRFVERCQNLEDPLRGDDLGDGGFFFDPDMADGNKAGQDGTDRSGRPRFRSYGSMTADGYRALVELGLGQGHPRARAAARWLERRWDPALNPGDFPRSSALRRDSAYYYWVWSSAHALRALGKPILMTDRGPVPWAEALIEELSSRQRPDGSWSNGATEMREDDPLVATPMAVAAIAIARATLAGERRSHSR